MDPILSRGCGGNAFVPMPHSAKPDIYEYLEERHVLYAIRLPGNEVLQREIAPLLRRPVGRPPKRPVILYDDFRSRAGSMVARSGIGESSSLFHLHEHDGWPRRSGAILFAQPSSGSRTSTLWTRLSCHQPGASVSVHSGNNLGNFKASPAVSAQGGQALDQAAEGEVLIAMGGSGAALPVVDLSVVRACRFLDGCSRECWIVSAGYRRPQAEGECNHFLSRGRALQGVALSSIRFHPIGGGPKTTKTDKKRRMARIGIPYRRGDWPCRT